MYGLLNSPLGEELATRIQFKPDYHGLVESDLVLINMGHEPDRAEQGRCAGHLDAVDPGRGSDATRTSRRSAVTASIRGCWR